MRLLLVLLFTLFLPACATITRGTAQAVGIDIASPSGTAPDWQVTRIGVAGTVRL